jgi:predicted pyridoxine 5'-phosphate oxidase superfamily flavin-nucleotide-binding protein
MAQIPQEAQKLFNSVKSVVFATASGDAQPNACVVGMKKIIDDQTIYLSDQFFNKTLANVRANAKVAVIWWGEDGAYEVHGTARYVNDGEEFAALKKWADDAFASMNMPIVAKGGAFVDVEAVYTSSPGPDAGSQIA